MSIFENLAASKVSGKIRAFLAPKGVAGPRAYLSRSVRRIASEGRKMVASVRKPARTLDTGRLPDSLSTPIFFVVGHQKSGTTWLMKMLDAHPEILCQGEGRPFGRNWHQEVLKKKKAGYPPTSLYNAILNSEDLRYWIERSVWSKREDPEEHLNNLTRLAVEYFLTQQLLKTGKKLVGDKTVLHEPGIIEEIGKICPGAKVIHIIRDGRDVAISQTHHRWNQAEDRGGTSNISSEQVAKREAYRRDPRALIESGGGIFPEGWLRNNAAKWRNKLNGAIEEGRALPASRYREVRYEDLLVKPGEEIQSLLKFLGADAGEQIVRECVDAASFEKLSRGRERGQEASSFFRKGIAGDWKNVFTEKDKQDFKAAAGDLLIELGYEEDSNW